MPGYHSHDVYANVGSKTRARPRIDTSLGGSSKLRTRRNEPVVDDPCNKSSGPPLIGQDAYPYRKWYSSTSSSSLSSKSATPTLTLSTSTMSSATTTTMTTASTATDAKTPPSTGSDWRVCYVLCQHDFSSSDRDHLSFRRNEVLEIVKKESSGWWAALRDNRIGWIPSAFVVEISEEIAESLLGTKEGACSYEYDDGRLYASVPVRVAQDNASTDSSMIPTPYSARDNDRDWVPILEPSGKTPFVKILSPSALMTPTDFPDDEVPPVLRNGGPLSPPQSSGSMDSFSTTDSGPEPPSERLPISASQGPRQEKLAPPCPRSPSTPMPIVPSSLKPKITPLLINKPMPPTPDSEPAFVASIKSSLRSPLFRSRSDSSPMASAASRSARRRPIMLSDSTSLSSLSVFIDSNSPSDVDVPDLYRGIGNDEKFTRSPVVGRRSDKVKQLTGDDDAQAFHNARLAQASLPWFLQPSYTSDDIKMDYDGSVRAGTLLALLERLTVDPLNLVQEDKYRHAFLTTFHTFSDAEEIFNLLIQRYRIDPPEDLTTEELDEWKEKKQRPVQKRVLTILSMWLEEHGLLNDDPRIAPRLREFLTAIQSPPSLALSARLMLQSLDRLSSPTAESPVSATTPSKKKKPTRSKTELLKMDPVDIAQQLTVYEYRLYQKIHPVECVHWAESQTGEKVANLVAFCSTNDKLAAWVKMSVLCNDGLGKRADMIDFWIKVAEKCRAFNNFSSMMAIVAALSSVVISRLHLTWAHVSRASHIDPLVRLMVPVGNFTTYRSLLASIDGPCIPFMSMYLTDIVHVQDQLKDTTSYPVATSVTSPTSTNASTVTLSPVNATNSHSNNTSSPSTESQSPTIGPPLINFVKRQRWYEAVHAIMRFQAKSHGFVENPQTMNYISEHLLLAISKDPASFWSRSQELQQHEVAHADIRKGLEAAGF